MFFREIYPLNRHFSGEGVAALAYSVGAIGVSASRASPVEVNQRGEEGEAGNSARGTFNEAQRATKGGTLRCVREFARRAGHG